MLDLRTEDATMDALLHPEVGDHFDERFSFHMFVVHVTPGGGPIVAVEANPPCQVPDDGKAVPFDSLADFVDRYTYKSMPHKSWVLLSGRGCDVRGWLDAIYPEVSK